MKVRDDFHVMLIIVIIVCLGVLSGWVIHQNSDLSSTLDDRHDQRSAQFNTLLCIAHQVEPTQASIDECFMRFGLEIP